MAGTGGADNEDGDDSTVITARDRNDTTVLGVKARETVPALVIAWHPNLSRVGQIALLTDLRRGKTLDARRELLLFQPRGGGQEQDLEKWLSKKSPAFHLQRRSNGDILILPGSSDTRVKVEDSLLEEPRTVTRDELARGVSIIIAQRIALVLEEVALPLRRGPALGMVGGSDILEDVRQGILRGAALAKDVLIQGETGTGKELVAKALVARSPRAKGPFVSVNMGGLNPATAISELFGHERGAFTGAVESHPGAFLSADGGTLFLDEIGDTHAQVQPMLLRALETREIQPLGARRSRRVDIRILLATDVKLREAIAAKTFDDALFFRLGDTQIKLPALRERREDIGPLLLHFLREKIPHIDERPTDPDATPWLAASFVGKLLVHPWPGNIRQLEKFAGQLAESSIGHDEAQFDERVMEILGPPDPPARSVPRTEAPKGISGDTFADLVRKNGFVASRVAKLLHMSPKTVYKRMREDPTLNVAADIPTAELLRLYHDCDGDIEKLSQRLQTSARALKLRLSNLETDPTPTPTPPRPRRPPEGA